MVSQLSECQAQQALEAEEEVQVEEVPGRLDQGGEEEGLATVTTAQAVEGVGREELGQGSEQGVEEWGLELSEGALVLVLVLEC